MIMYKIISGKEPAEEVLREIEQRAKKLHRKPVLGIVVIGEYKPSQIYVKRKIETADRVGIATEIHRLTKETSETELLMLINKLNKNDGIDGYIIQTPLPNH